MAFYPSQQDWGSVTATPDEFDDWGLITSAPVASWDLNRDYIQPALLQNSPSFFAPAVVNRNTLTPARYDNAQTFYAPTAAARNTLTPALFSNSPTFYAATVGRGPVGLLPARYNNAQIFYGPTVLRGAIALSPARLDNAQTFHGPTLLRGAVTLAPSLYANTGAFYTASLANLQQRYARPEADVSQGLWTPSSGSDLYAMVDEDPENDTDFISAATPTTCQMRLQPVRDPQTSSGQVVRYRARSSTGSTLVARLKQGSTTIATATHAGVAASFTEYSMTLTAGECDAITDYADLRVELEAV
jgi:hypothetical protein